jgi:hypothetical protein
LAGPEKDGGPGKKRRTHHENPRQPHIADSLGKPEKTKTTAIVPQPIIAMPAAASRGVGAWIG